MPVYYIRVDTDNKDISVRSGNMIDEINETFFSENYSIFKYRLVEMVNAEWDKFESLLEMYSYYYKTKYDPRYYK